MWAIANYYQDQQDDLEKYKLICRFVNPEAARAVWDQDSVETTESSDYADFLQQVQAHSKQQINPAELADRIHNPEKYDIDTIERVR